MASSSGPALNEELQCPICMEEFPDPVTTPCGHNFCRTCLTNTQTCFCPFCKERSSKILDLESNTAQRLTEVMQNFKEKLDLGESKVFCDFCDERKQKAVKSCLMCQSSYCDDHLEPHRRVPRLKKHKLINAVENLEDYICQKHERPLEMFCRDDQTRVCLFCTEGDHRTHNTVPIEEESQEEKLVQTDKQQMIQDKMKENQESEHSVELRKASSSEVESAARALIEVLARGLAASSSGGTSSTRENVRLSEASDNTPLPTLPEPENRVRQALKRQFSSMFRTESDQPRGKKPFSLAKPVNVKKTDFQIDVLSKQTLFTPKKDEDLELLHAGLGKRLLSFPDNFKHSEIVTLLEEEFPKLKTLQGGWMFYKSTGNSGRRKLTLIPTDSDGYSTRLLKSVSKNGKNMLFAVPLQEQLSIEPLPYDAVEFAKMPLSNCMKCGKKIPLPLLPLHIEECNTTETESVNDVILHEEHDDEIVSGATDQPSPLYKELEEPSEESVNDMILHEELDDEIVSGATDQPSPIYTELEEPSEICPICQISFPADVLPYHASMCGEGERSFSDSDSPSTSTRHELPGPSMAQSYTSLSAAWKYETDPLKASQMFRAELLSENRFCPSMSLMINQFDTVDEQDRTLISFYKKNSTNWSAPLRCSLIGDEAVGTGVNRHIFSMIMQKLKTGFSLNLGSAATTLFEGEKNHRVPSASVVLRDSNLFQMAGRMIGHSFIHGGPCLSGLSLPVVILLTGGSADSAASALTLQDCPDLDHRETIRLLKKTKLTEEERTRLSELCLFWDLPVPSSTNRDWLFQQLLSHAVIGRVKSQIKDLRKGIKETGIWPLLSQRHDMQRIVFPRDSVMEHYITDSPSKN
ncbi:uncharacterized protein LOC125260283 isoform X2 [Megalobrama amblycephala]|uniref:uncharacterized protein LOC125260283 isoform X2 n=1 Tax=Megalobrama amblycephala TaxID=75352 RepID=UPI0020146AB2|nr:uncharacterized protein LOC125260283 isoform X2 [Megalobrama amblycephala]